jgi:hypothetical protein
VSLWGAAGSGPFSAPREGPARADAVERVKDWTRGRFALGADDTVLVVEVAGTLPGFPPRETLVAFWGGDERRHHFKVFKAVEDVAEADLPPAWLKESLALSGGIECLCC